MILWILFALMTAAAILAVLWPLGRGPRRLRGGSDVLVYKDQLQEIDRDRAAGLIGEAEAEAARLEVSRRLLSAADADEPAAPEKAAKAQAWGLRRRAATAAALIILPLGPPSLYLALGSPNLPGQSAFARDKPPHGLESIAALVGQVEAHLAQDPKDGRGWELLAPVYLRLGRFDDAVEARRKALALNGETAERRADLGEALADAADGVVTARAKSEFERAVALDPHEAKARYFLGLAAEQDGNVDEAKAIWHSIIAEAPPDAPYVEFVGQALARVGGKSDSPPGRSNVVAAAPEAGPTAKDVEAAGNMTAGERGDMIRGMVGRLADRLHQDGTDVDGWLRLVRAYVVLGEVDKAKGAVDDAKRALADRPDAIKRIDDLVKGLGLEG